MLHQESHTPYIENYLLGGTEIKEWMRVRLLDWIVQIHLNFDMFPRTLFIVVAILDKYLAITARKIKSSEFQLIGAAAFYIAAKYEETYHVPEAY